jgi:hypothetical protein
LLHRELYASASTPAIGADEDGETDASVDFRNEKSEARIMINTVGIQKANPLQRLWR